MLTTVVGAVALAAVLGLKSSAFAAGVGFTVTSTADAVDANVGNGVCATSTGACTLRAAIQETNALPGADTITLPAGTYALAIPPLNQNLADNGDLDITGGLAILGAGAGSTFVDGGTPKAGAPVQVHGLDRLFEISADGATVAFADLTVQEGWADEHGGAIMNSSSALVTVVRSTFLRNGAGKTGGAIDNHFGGSLDVRASTLSDNYAPESGSAINNNRGGTLTVADSIVSSNSAADAGLDESLLGAGAIANNAELDAIGTITVTDSEIAGNRAAGGRPGAGISNDGAGTMLVTDTTFDDNVSLANGGALFNNNGQVTVADSTFSENAGDSGGAISSTGLGSIEVLDSVFTKNRATDWGGAMHNGNKGSASIRSSVFAENSALNGGGFGNEGSGLVVVESSSFTKNMAIDTATQVGGEGGGMTSNSDGVVVVTGGSFTENQAVKGGGFSNEGGGQVTLTGTRVAANRAAEQGGGLLIESGAVRMVGVDVVGNSSDSPLEGGGGISYAGDKSVAVGESAAIEVSRIRDNTSKGDGGGIDSRGDGPLAITTTSITGNSALIGGAVHHVGDAPLVVHRSTVSGNTADNGAGIFSDGDGEATIENSTLSGNRASQFGGGLLVSARVAVRNSTISANSAASGGGINNGGGDLVGDGSVFLLNTIVSGNPAGGNCAGTVTSEGGNVEATDTCQLTQLSDQPGTDPHLGPLGDNGGPTHTHALLAGSPAQEAAVCTDVSPCPAVDQRGIERPLFPAADAGAYESETTPGGDGGAQVCSGRTERPVPADYDSWVSQSSPSTNRGTDAILNVMSQGGVNERVLLHFALPPTPPGCELVGASLRLHSSAGTDGRTLEVRRLTAPWAELGVTWSNQPAAAGPAASSASGLGVRQWDVLPQALEMYASGAHGFVVRDASENQTGKQSFHSREKGADQPPELLLVFDDPDGTPSPDRCDTTPQSFAADSDSWVSEGSPTNNFGTDTSLKVKSQTGSNARALVRFPLPTLPGGCTSIASATLRLEASSAKELRTIEAQRIASEWAENGVTWANRPATVGPAASAASVDGPLEWEVTEQVLAIYMSANHGFQIRDAEENGVGEEQTLNGRLKVNDFPPELVLVFDHSTPETDVLGPATPTAETSATFTLLSDRGDATFECSLDGGAFAACSSPFALSELAEGEHRLDVRAKRPVRAVDPTPASHVWTIAIPPETTLAGPSSPSASADALLTFSADDPAASFECSLDGGPWVGCASPVEYTNLADGERELEVRATDQLGNVEPVPARHAWTIAVPPETTLDSGPNELSNDTSPSFAFGGSDNGPAAPELEFACRLDDAAYDACVSPQGYEALADGEHTFSVVATDAAGNVDASPASRTWTIDTVAPETTISESPPELTNEFSASLSFVSSEPDSSFVCSLDGVPFTPCESPVEYEALEDGEHTFSARATDAAGNEDGSEATATWTVDTTPPNTSISSGPVGVTRDADASFSFASTDEGSTFACALDGDFPVSCTSPAGYAGLADGAHTFSVAATDAAGNEDLSADSRTWTIDTTPPESSIDSGPDDPGNDATPTFTFSTSEEAVFRCSFDEEPLAACTSPLTSTELPEGAHTFFVEATDAVGNVEREPASYAFAVDLTAPETTIDSGPDDPGNDATPTFAFSASESATFRCSVDEGPAAACTSSFTSAVLGEGEHSFTVQATDTAGNVEAEAASVLFTIDLTTPNTTIEDGPAALTNEADASFSFTSTETESTFVCTLDGNASSCTSPASYTGLADGEHTFSVAATDAAGNEDLSPASETWTVDTVAPESSIDTGPADPGNDATPTFVFSASEAATFRCSLDGAPLAACASPLTTAELAEGEHSFAVQSTDTAANVEAEAASVSFTVDLTAPGTAIADGPSGLTNDAAASFSFTSTETGSSFVCTLDGTAAACESPASYTGLADGERTFSVRATDAAGNEDASGATRVWSIDTVAPATSITDAPAALTNEPVASFSFASTETGSSFECLLDGAASSCTSPASYTALADGEHTFTVRATDAAGNADATPAARTWTIDTTEPLTSITSGPPESTTDTSATFEFSASELDATFACALDEGAFAACTSPHLVTGLGLGPHTLAVRATDAAGNTDATPATRSWTVRSTDTTAPETTITAGPTGATNQTTATFEFAANEPATFRCRLDAAPFAACTSPFSTGTLGEGTYTFEVQATDAAGLVDESSASRTFTVDTTAPQTTITAGPQGTTTSATAEFEFTSSELGSSFECSLDGAGFSPCASPVTYTVAAGSHAFEVQARDAAGNLDETSASRAWTVLEPDTTAPETTIASGPSGPTPDWTPTFEFTASEAATFRCRVDAAAFAACSSPHTTAALSDGAHTFEVQATDSAGNIDTTAASRSFTVDTAAPQTTITAAPAATTNSTTAQFEFTSTETESTFGCSLDGAPFAACSSPATYTVGLGSHTFQVQARDAAGNLDPSPATSSWTVQPGDSTPPETTITGGPNGLTNDSTPTFTFSSESGATFQCRVDTTAFAPCTSPHTTPALTQGPHTFEVRATDASGNVDLSPAGRSITVDTIAPQTTITTGPTGPTNDATPTFELSASEAATFQCRVDTAAFASCSSPHTTASLAAGSHTFQARAIDSAGNTDASPASAAFTVDTTAPNTTITQAPPATTSSATVSFQFNSNETGTSFACSLDGSGFAPCASPVTYTVSPGPHQFQVRSRDAAGNDDPSPATAAWTFQQADTTPPETTITNGPPETTTSATVSFEFTSGETGSSFECSLDGAGFAPCSSPVSYTVSPGSHQFQVRARDAAGNTDQSPASRSWTLEPPPGCAGAGTVTRGASTDSWLLESSPSSNYGNDSVLKVDTKSGANARAVVRFALPAIPSGCQVLDARLRLYGSSYKIGRTIDAYAVTTGWLESTLTWANQPPPVGSPASAPSGPGYVDWNVTAQLASTYAANTGFLVRDRTEGGGGIEQGYHSREKGTDNPPQLVITFG